MFQNNNGAVVKHLAKKSFKANRNRNIFVILTLALTAFMITSVFSIGSSYIKTSELQQLRLMGTNVHAALTNPDETQMDILKKELSDYVTDAGIAHRLGSIVNTQKNDALLGLGWLDETEWKNHRLPTVSGVVGKYPTAENEIMMPTWALEEFGIQNPQVGMSIPLSYQLSTAETTEIKDFVLSGYYQDYSQTRTGNRGSVYVSKEFRDGTDIPLENGGAAMLRFTDTENVEGISDKIGQRLSLRDGQSFEIVPLYQNSSNSLSIMIAAIIAFICFSGYLLIYNVLYISVSKDIQFYGLLKTIGTTKKQIKRMVQWQVLKLCGIGIPCGLAAGAVTSFGIVPMTLRVMFPTISDAGIEISFSLTIFIGAAVFALITALIGSMKPAKIAGNISPIEAVRYSEAKNMKKKGHKARNGGKPFPMAWRNVFRNKKSAVITFASLFFGLTTFLLTTGLLSSLSADNFVKDWGESDFVVTYDVSKTTNEPITKMMVEEIEKIESVQDVRITTTLPAEKSLRVVDVTYDSDVFSDYILSLASNPEIKDSMDFSDPQVRQRYTENFYGYIYGIDTRYVEELNQNLDTPIDISQFENGNVVLLSEVLDSNGNSVFPSGKDIQIKNPYTSELVSYQIASGFLVSSFQSVRGTTRGSAPNMYVSLSAMEKLVNQPSVFRVEIQSGGKEDAKILAQLKDITAGSSNINILSRYEKAEEIRGYLVTTRV
ncbi:MAG: ABC transporter permease, partial [Ruminiclostridium sp.]